MDEFQIFDSKNIDAIREYEKCKQSKYCGFVYIIEWNNVVKIGSTLLPSRRMCQLKQFQNYSNATFGKIAINSSSLYSNRE